jgi:hypothetical protein
MICALPQAIGSPSQVRSLIEKDFALREARMLWLGPDFALERHIREPIRSAKTGGQAKLLWFSKGWVIGAGEGGLGVILLLDVCEPFSRQGFRWKVCGRHFIRR